MKVKYLINQLDKFNQDYDVQIFIGESNEYFQIIESPYVGNKSVRFEIKITKEEMKELSKAID